MDWSVTKEGFVFVCNEYLINKNKLWKKEWDCNPCALRVSKCVLLYIDGLVIQALQQA